MNIGLFLINVVSTAFTIYYFMMFVYIISSWIPAMRESKFVQMIAQLVEPYLNIFRKIIPPLGMIDISPLIGIILFRFISDFALRGLITVFDLIGLL
ncbi:YggT family protein [Evansella sp. LMS18]|jgi:YggT family protein|uniref:YggT family protein n=1 Tax=Evansella sp. LMS18 TaxID=2924033 RepID=UPI0020D16565|nr:YggT family protein [Evansella sp. LMS18]UTR10396.1 YggT family protein [Evansella sp. LMS18]